MIHKFLIAVAFTLVLTGCVTTPTQVTSESDERFKAMTLESVSACISSEDHALESTIKYDTQKCFVQEHGILRKQWDDAFVRAWKDKSTGLTKYQIYFVDYGNNWQYPTRLSYKHGDRVVSSNAERIHSDVSCGTYRCTHREDVGFIIENEFLQNLSTSYDTLSTRDVLFRIEKKNSANQDWTFNAAELVGLFRTVESKK